MRHNDVELKQTRSDDSSKIYDRRHASNRSPAEQSCLGTTRKHLTCWDTRIGSSEANTVELDDLPAFAGRVGYTDATKHALIILFLWESFASVPLPNQSVAKFVDVTPLA